jgi:hypothetical protein
MAMDASKIAKLADVDLEDFGLGMAKWQRMFDQFPRETVAGNQVHKCRRAA